MFNDLNEFKALLETHDLIGAGMRADEERRRIHGARTTFQRVWEVHCDAVPATRPVGVSAGEVRLIGRPSSIEAAEQAVRAVAAVAGGVPVSGFALHYLQRLAGDAHELPTLFARLRAAGLALIAELAVDVTHDARAAVAAAREAGLALTRMTVHAIDDPGDRVAVLAAARDLQASAGGFRAFAPLPRTTSIARPSTGYDDVKLVAAARLAVTGIDSIQVDWLLNGPKLAQVALTVGADDVDGVAAVETGALGQRRTALEEIRGNIKAAALEPVERNARWEAIGA